MKIGWVLALLLASVAMAHETSYSSERTYIDTNALKKNLGQSSASTIFSEKHRQIPTSNLAAPSVVTGERFNENHINRAIAEWSLRQVNGSLPVVEDAWVNEQIFTMTAAMNAQVRTQALLALPIIQDDAINAFAVPGGLIGINTGTILSSETMDEVASVLAHEIAHLSQRHYEQRQDEKGKLLALQLGGLLAAVLASSVNGDLATTALIGSQTAAAETMATHSRDHEREADRIGMQIMSQAGYDAKAMAVFFGKLYKQVSYLQSKDVFIPSFVQSHPLTAERLSDATSRANQYPVMSMIAKINHAKMFDRLSWRLKYLTKQANTSELKEASTHSMGAKLAYVSALADEGKTKQALSVLNEAMNKAEMERTEPLVCITHAHVLTKQGEHAQAATVLKSCQALYPERRDLRLHLAQALAQTGQTATALSLIKPLTEQDSHDRQAWRTTQKIHEKSANSASSAIYALHARSQVELWDGQYQGALQSNAQAIKIAKQHPNLNLLPMLERSKQMMIQARDYKP